MSINFLTYIVAIGLLVIAVALGLNPAYGRTIQVDPDDCATLAASVFVMNKYIRDSYPPMEQVEPIVNNLKRSGGINISDSVKYLVVHLSLYFHHLVADPMIRERISDQWLSHASDRIFQFCVSEGGTFNLPEHEV